MSWASYDPFFFGPSFFSGCSAKLFLPSHGRGNGAQLRRRFGARLCGHGWRPLITTKSPDSGPSQAGSGRYIRPL